MVYLRFLVSSQPFFIFSGCLMSIIKREGSCGLSINMKYVGKGTSAAENSGYFPACSAVVMLKIEARSVYTRMRGRSSTPARNKSKKNRF